MSVTKLKKPVAEDCLMGILASESMEMKFPYAPRYIQSKVSLHMRTKTN